MPHQCVKCNTIFETASSELLRGCPNCRGKFFFFIKQEKLEKTQEMTKQLSLHDKEQIEKDVKDILGTLDDDAPIILDLASVNVLEPGKFELDLVRLFKGEPMVVRLEDGKYIIDIASTFDAFKSKEKKK